MGETILKMQGIQKYFAGVHALNGVNFELRAGEVHALMGENGAGKSTLIKVLCGIHQRDGGTVEYFGEEVNFHNIAQSQEAGISVIHQELNMMGHLTVAQNMFIGREFMMGSLINDKAMEEEAQRLFDKMGVKIDPTAMLGSDDILAVVLEQFCGKLGLRVPKDLSIVSFNNSLFSRITSPQLTTVDVNPYQLGMEAASQTINHIENPNLLATKILVPHKLIPRESCCPPPEI